MSTEVLYERKLSEQGSFCKVLHVLRDISTNEVFTRIGCYQKDDFELLPAGDRLKLSDDETARIIDKADQRLTFKLYLPNSKRIEGFYFEYLKLFQISLLINNQLIARVILSEQEIKVLVDNRSEILDVFRNELKY